MKNIIIVTLWLSSFGEVLWKYSSREIILNPGRRILLSGMVTGM